jgi:hypothetical protein
MLEFSLQTRLKKHTYFLRLKLSGETQFRLLRLNLGQFNEHLQSTLGVTILGEPSEPLGLFWSLFHLGNVPLSSYSLRVTITF